MSESDAFAQIGEWVSGWCSERMSGCVSGRVRD